MRTLLLFALAFPALAAISSTPVQQNNCTGSGATCVVTLGANVTAGNFVVVQATSGSSTILASSVAGGGCTWAKTVASHASTTRESSIFEGVNCTGGSATITLTMSGTIVSSVHATAAEFSGVATASPRDGSGVSNNGSSTTATTGTYTPTASQNTLLVAVTRNSGSCSALSAGWTALTSPNGASCMAYQVVSSTSGSYTANWTVGSGAWETQIAGFKAAAGGGGGGTTVKHRVTSQ